MHKIFPIMCALVVAVLAGCGSTSNIQPGPKPQAAAETKAAPEKAAVDFSGYDSVVVFDLVDATAKSAIKPEHAQAYADTMQTAVRTFADLIAQKIRATGVYAEVVRGPAEGKALIVSGRITRYVEGNAALRFFIGLGAGSSYFDASVDLTDAETGKVLGRVVVDKNSWALGGGIAAGQSVDHFMKGAADKIAAQLREARAGPVAREKS
jgi:hypothetical protein